MSEINQSLLPRSPEQLNWINDLTSIVPQNGVVVEIGTYVGNFSLRFVNGIRKVFCVDVWDQEGADKSFLKQGADEIFTIFCQNAGDELFKTVFPLRFPSAVIVPYFNLPIDLLYIDGLHDYENTKNDISAWALKIKKGGIICGDDYGGGFEGVKRAVDELIPQHGVACGNQWYAQKQ